MKRLFIPFVMLFSAALCGCTEVDNSVVPPPAEVSPAPQLEAMESLVEEGGDQSPIKN